MTDLSPAEVQNKAELAFYGVARDSDSDEPYDSQLLAFTEGFDHGYYRALMEAASALEGSLGVEGMPQGPYDFRKWLRERAAAAGLR